MIMEKNNKLEFVTQVCESHEEYTVELSNGKLKEDICLNNIYIDHKYNVSTVFYKSREEYGSSSIIDSVYIFSKTKDDCLKYLNYIISEFSSFYKNDILKITDSFNGIKVSVNSKECSVNYNDVFLEESLKNEIINSIDSFFKGDLYQKYNIPRKRGILLYGKPGNGKTTLLKAITNMMDCVVVYWQINEETNSTCISQTFDLCRNLSNVLLVIEDIDSIPERTRSTFLNYLDGGSFNAKGIFVIGTTNFPEKIDPALMNRAGRFDRAYEIKCPSEDMRYKYLMKLGIGEILEADEITYVNKKIDGFSMSMLNEVYTSIILNLHYNRDKGLDKIISDLRNINNKQVNDKWYEENNKLGF